MTLAYITLWHTYDNNLPTNQFISQLRHVHKEEIQNSTYKNTVYYPQIILTYKSSIVVLLSVLLESLLYLWIMTQNQEEMNIHPILSELHTSVDDQSFPSNLDFQLLYPIIHQIHKPITAICLNTSSDVNDPISNRITRRTNIRTAITRDVIVDAFSRVAQAP